MTTSMTTSILTNPIIEELWESFAESKEYRDNFVAAFVKKSIPSQIRAWMKKQRITTQQELAKRSGITQGVISRAANPNYGDLALNTIIKIGSGFDCVFVGKYIPYSEFCNMVVDGSFAEDADTMLSFEEENNRLKEERHETQDEATESHSWLEEEAAGLGGPNPALASTEEEKHSNNNMVNEPSPKRPQSDVGTLQPQKERVA